MGEWRTMKGRCNLCNTCQIYIEGPLIGRCIYGGPFHQYLDLRDEQKVESGLDKGDDHEYSMKTVDETA